ncbi:MAG: LysO family transporter [Bacteroidales bacterium]|nr:LysO family transporter [Bacteroidales bacterium]
MIFLLSILFIGIFLGYLFRKRKIEKTIDILTTISIYGLLFFIGISVGANETIVKNLDKIGFNALILTLAAVAGSIYISYFVYKFFFIKKNER